MRYLAVLLFVVIASCSKKDSEPEIVTPPNETFKIGSSTSEDISTAYHTHGISFTPTFKISFTAPVKTGSAEGQVTLTDVNNSAVPLNILLQGADTILNITPKVSLNPISKYTLKISSNLLSKNEKKLGTEFKYTFVTHIDSSDKFTRVSDDELLTIIQKQHFKYFWDFGHPVSGMARERNTSGDLVTTGGTGFGVLSILTGIHRGFITREEGLQRVQKIVSFLKTAPHFHGAFSHWMNGNTGAVIPFSAKDDGADLVETSLLMQGLITARQYFNQAGSEQTLRDDINFLWNRVEWSFFQNGQNKLYWHYSPNGGFIMNVPISGWNEALITYVLAASSKDYSITKEVYEQGWARNGAMKNNKKFSGVTLPLGPDAGGPLFLAHYSFLTIDPRGLKDQYADYMEQNTAHTRINYEHCRFNYDKFYGYSQNVWGLTASDDPYKGYDAHSPTNDNGVISPTAAIASMPYMPTESMNALRFYYYTLGDKLFKNYGFIDAFSLHEPWFADSFLAIDQGPIIVMIENYRSQLLWDLFMSAPEIKTGMTKLGFQSPKL